MVKDYTKKEISQAVHLLDGNVSLGNGVTLHLLVNGVDYKIVYDAKFGIDFTPGDERPYRTENWDYVSVSIADTKDKNDEIVLTWKEISDGQLLSDVMGENLYIVNAYIDQEMADLPDDEPDYDDYCDRDYRDSLNANYHC